jgi:hypothetical protein
MEEAIMNMAKAKYWSTGEIDTKGMNAMSNGLKLMGVIESTPDWGTLVDSQFLK